jgi:hypothetical protein
MSSPQSVSMELMYSWNPVVCMYVYLYTYIYVCKCVYTYIYKHIYVYIYMYIYLGISIPSSYTSFVAPLSSSKLWMNAKSQGGVGEKLCMFNTQTWVRTVYYIRILPLSYYMYHDISRIIQMAVLIRYISQKILQ